MINGKSAHFDVPQRCIASPITYSPSSPRHVSENSAVSSQWSRWSPPGREPALPRNGGTRQGKTEYNQGIVYNTHMNEIHLLLSSIIGFHTLVEMWYHRDAKRWEEAQCTDPRIIWISVFPSASRPFPPHDRRSNQIFRITRYTGQRIRNDRCP